MQIGADGYFHLTYCTNIHPGNGWSEVFANLRRYAPTLKARVAPNRPFGLGLRLSGDESRELLEGEELDHLRAFLDEHGLYVFTLNGFPYGPFHRQPVKADVHAPDWRDEERVQYTLRLITILAALLPDGMEGGISTNPLSYRAWVDLEDSATWQHFTRNIVRMAEALMEVRQRHGKLIHLDLEPEPDGVLENAADVVDFYQNWLLTAGARMLAEVKAITIEEAQAHLLDHIQVCFDTCHMAVAFEDPAHVLDCFAETGIRVGKVQISAALKVPFPDDRQERGALAGALQPFTNSVYLHQVVQRNDDESFQQYRDLPEALSRIDDPHASQWRIHFHVPIFVERYGTFLSTQDEIQRVFALLREQHFSRHLEIETYTWEVLPPDLRQDLVDSISREYAWVRDVFI